MSVNPLQERTTLSAPAFDFAVPIGVHGERSRQRRKERCGCGLPLAGAHPPGKTACLSDGSMWASTPTSFFRRNRKSRQKDTAWDAGVHPALAQRCAPKLYIAASTRYSLYRIKLQRRLHRTVLSMIVVATQEHWRIDCHDKHNAPAHSPGNFRQIRRCVSIFENLVGADAHIRPYKSTTVMYTVFRLQSRIEIRLWLSTIACSTFVSTASHKHRCKSAPE